MSKKWLVRVFELETTMDTSGFERTNTKLVRYHVLSDRKAADMLKQHVDASRNKRAIIKEFK